MHINKSFGSKLKSDTKLDLKPMNPRNGHLKFGTSDCKAAKNLYGAGPTMSLETFVLRLCPQVLTGDSQ